MITLHLPQAKIKFSDYEKFILPWLVKQSTPSLILYKIEEHKLRIRTFMDGFIIVTCIPCSDITKMYQEKETEVGLNAPPDISKSDILNKFNQDYMDGRGIPELD